MNPQLNTPRRSVDIDRMTENLPKLYKITAVCDKEFKKKSRDDIGGNKISFKLLIPRHEDFMNVVDRSNLLLNVINKEYPEYNCKLTHIELVRNIAVSSRIVDPKKPTMRRSINNAFNSLVGVVANRLYEDHVILITDYDCEGETCNYALIKPHEYLVGHI